MHRNADGYRCSARGLLVGPPYIRFRVKTRCVNRSCRPAETRLRQENALTRCIDSQERHALRSGRSPKILIERG
jgi:hypothetical protein